jgi:hypothetical protein
LSVSLKNKLFFLFINKNVPTHQKENHLLSAMTLVQNLGLAEALVMAKANRL